MDVEEFKIRKDSFNSMFQGEVPWAPGFGPMVQVPVTQIAARTFPEIADPNFEIGGVPVGQHPLLRQLFGFGLPKTGTGLGDLAASAGNQFVPGWMRRLGQIADGEQWVVVDRESAIFSRQPLLRAVRAEMNQRVRAGFSHI